MFSDWVSSTIIRFSLYNVKLQIDDIIDEKATKYGKNGEDFPQVFSAPTSATGTLENDVL